MHEGSLVSVAVVLVIFTVSCPPVSVMYSHTFTNMLSLTVPVILGQCF